MCFFVRYSFQKHKFLNFSKARFPFIVASPEWVKWYYGNGSTTTQLSHKGIIH